MKTTVLEERQIEQKLDRIAYQIYEDTFEENTLLLIGIHGNGIKIAHVLAEKLKGIGKQNITVCEISIDKKKPLDHPITTDINLDDYQKHPFILIDDVINSGRTMQYALIELLKHAPTKLKTVALVDRKHRNYPIRCDYVGLTLSTTLQDRIEVDFEDHKKAYLV